MSDIMSNDVKYITGVEDNICVIDTRIITIIHAKKNNVKQALASQSP